MEYNKILDYLKTLFTPDVVTSLVQFFITVAIIFIVYKATIKHILTFAEKVLKIKNALAIARFIKYVFVTGGVLYVLDLFGVNISTLLGMAGVFSVAIGFAAQTSFSNIISGFFIISDKALKNGDFIEIEGITGNVHSIDLLSVKVLTPDNQMIRVPNETIIKSNLINSTFYKNRRTTISVSVDYNADLRKVREVLLAAAHSVELVLKDPEPVILFDTFADSGINVFVAVWFKKENFWDVKNELFIRIHESLKDAGISIPFPQMDVHFDKDNNLPFEVNPK